MSNTNSVDYRLYPGDVAINESGTVYSFGPAYGETHFDMAVSPIVRAVLVARLRALADLIEKGGA